MEYIEDIIKKKIEVARTYNKLLKGIPGITLPYEADNVRNIYWMYGILIEGEFGVSRDRLKELLFKKGIETRFFFTGLHKQPPFKTEGTFPVSDALEKKGVYLPCSPHILPEQLEFVATSIKEAYNEHKQ
jgi:perosamine synthetase